MYTPDTWTMIRIVKNNETIYKILGGWSGGYADGDSWRLNSGVISAELDGDYILFTGFSGSMYRCHKDTYRITMATAGVWNYLEEQAADDDDLSVDLMPEDTNWTNYDYGAMVDG